MEKKLAGLTGALALAAAAPAQAAPPAQPLSRASAYAELLKPIPDAIAKIKAADAATPGEAARPPADPPLQLAQYWGGYHHHWYHHHHRYWGWGRWRHWHHHHHWYHRHHHWWRY